MPRRASVRPLLAAAVGCVVAPRLAPAFTLIEKLVPVTVVVDPAQSFSHSYVVWGGYTDSTMTNFVGVIEPLGSLLPAIQNTFNVALTVPLNSFDSAASVLMCDGSVRVAAGLNGNAAANAIGKTFAQVFNDPNTPSEQTIINAFVQGDTATLSTFFQNNFAVIGSPLTTNSNIVGFSTGVADGTEQVIQRPPGDANFDGVVNFADLVILAQHYGQSNATYATGDFNGDGIVNFSDLVILAQNYGKSITPAVSAAAAVQVPEPAIAGLVGAATGALLVRRRLSR